MLDIRTAQTTLEDAVRDAILYSLGKRLPPVATVAALRQIITVGESKMSTRTNDDLAVVLTSPTISSYRWSAFSTVADNGTTVIQPNDQPGPGRWVQWSSPLRFAPVVGGDCSFLNELTAGPVQRVIVLDRSMDEDEIGALISGQVPSVIIEAMGDQPQDMTLATGFRYATVYQFKVSVIAQNLRDYREHAQDSPAPADAPSVIGANALDGFVKAILGGTAMTSVVDGIRNVQIGHGENWFSEFGQRRVIRSHVYNFQVTEVNPACPNDFGPAEEVDLQAELTDLHSSDPPFTAENYLIDGMLVSSGPGLVKPITAGNAVIATAPVVYAGQLATFSPYADTYRDLLPNGTVVLVTVAAQGEPPAVTPTALRIGMTRTDGSGVVCDQILAATRAPYGNPFVVPLI